MLEEKLNSAPIIRVFIGTTTLQGNNGDMAAAVYKPSKIDEIYMAMPHNPETGTGLKPCGKVKLMPDLEFADNAGVIHKGVVLVPEDKSEAILAGCSMQHGRLTKETAQAQLQQYQTGRSALLELQA